MTLYENKGNHPPIIQDVKGIHIQACFTPQQRCQKFILKALQEAQTTVHVMAYYLTAPPLIEALIAAHKRGVTVKVLVDRSQIKQSPLLPFLFRAGIPLLSDQGVSIAHNKVMIIDQQIVITGSYNFTAAADYKNAENILFIKSPALASVYQAYWNQRERSSTPLFFPKTSQGTQRKKKMAFDYFIKNPR